MIPQPSEPVLRTSSDRMVQDLLDITVGHRSEDREAEYQGAGITRNPSVYTDAKSNLNNNSR